MQNSETIKIVIFFKIKMEQKEREENTESLVFSFFSLNFRGIGG